MKYIAGLIPLLVVGTASALPGNLSSGNQISTGGVTLQHSPPSMGNNPAMLRRTLGTEDLILGGISLPTFAIEFGDVDEVDVVANLDQLESDIDCAEDDTRTFSDREACANNINGVLADTMDFLAKEGRANMEFVMPVPFLPAVFRAFDGVVSVNAEGASNVGMRVLNSNTEAVVDQTNGTINIIDDTAAYVKSAVILDLGLGYSRKMMNLSWDNGDAELHLGGRLHLMQGQLSRQIAIVNDDSDETAFDRVEDNYDSNEETSTGFALDLGVSVLAKNYTLGLSVRNALAPEFDYGDLGTDCANKPTPEQVADCTATQAYTDPTGAYATTTGKEAIPAKESYKLDPQSMLEASYDLGPVVLFGSYELNPVENINGQEYQWMHLGVSIPTPGFPIRLGYRSNLADGGMDVLSAGISIMRIISVEVFQATETAEFDGDEYPRSGGISVGLFKRF